MDNKNTPAFPQVWDPAMRCDPRTTPPGLTKREYFVAMAMQGISVKYFEYISTGPERVAEHAILIADALLAKLESQK